jgi:hypothetical protein
LVPRQHDIIELIPELGTDERRGKMDSRPPEAKPERAILLARQSTKQDDRHGTRNQIRDLREFCEEEGIGIGPEETHVIIEAAVSGWSEGAVFDDAGNFTGYRTDRPEYQRALNMLRTREADGLIVPRCDRGMRNNKDLNALADIVRASCPGKYDPPAIYCWSVDGTFDLRTAQGINQTYKNVETARESSAITSINVAASHKRRARDGIYRGGGNGGRPRGYALCEPRTADGNECPDCNGSRLRLIPEEADIIRIAVPGILAGKTWREIEEDILLRFPRYERWNIRSTILNPTVAGLSVYRGNVVGEGKWEPILDEETWNAVGNVLRNPARTTNKPGGRKVKYIGSGLYRCSLPGCDGVMGAGVRRDGDRREAGYSCGTCNGQRRPVSIVDAKVSARMIEVLSRPDAAGLLPERAPDNSSEIAELTARIGTLEGKAAETRDLFRSGALDRDQAADWMNGINRELRLARSRLASLSRPRDDEDPDGIFANPDAAAIWAKLPDMRKRAIIRKVAMVWVGSCERRGRKPEGAGPDDGNIFVFLRNGDTDRPENRWPGSPAANEAREILSEMFAEQDTWPVSEIIAMVEDGNLPVSYKTAQNIRRSLGIIARHGRIPAANGRRHGWVWTLPGDDSGETA